MAKWFLGIFIFGISSLVHGQPLPTDSALKASATVATGRITNIEDANFDDAKIEQELSALKKAPTPSSPTPAADKSTESKNGEIKEANAALGSENLKKESEIPVLNNSIKKEVKTSSVTGIRVTIGLVIVAVFLFSLWWASQKWLSKKRIKNPHTSIRVLTQHYLGPKKSLAIISVAGEPILIGVTDHNINFIKSLSLLEEEVPHEESRSFSSALQSAEQAPNEEIEDYAVKGIKDVVSDRLKGMRNLW